MITCAHVMSASVDDILRRWQSSPQKQKRKLEKELRAADKDELLHELVERGNAEPRDEATLVALRSALGVGSDLTDPSVQITKVKPTAECQTEMCLVTNMLQGTIAARRGRGVPSALWEVMNGLIHTEAPGAEITIATNMFCVPDPIKGVVDPDYTSLNELGGDMNDFRDNPAALRELRQYLSSPSTDMFALFILIGTPGEGDLHHNALFCKRNTRRQATAWLFEPHVDMTRDFVPERDGESWGWQTYRHNLTAFFSKEAGIKFSADEMMPTGFRLQGRDSFCQTWCAYYVFLRATSMANREALEQMNKAKLHGLLAFARKVLTTDALLGRQRGVTMEEHLSNSPMRDDRFAFKKYTGKRKTWLYASFIDVSS